MHALVQFWHGLHLVWKFLIGLAVALGAFVKFREDLHKTWEWGISLYDRPVMALLEKRAREMQFAKHPITLIAVPLTVDEVSSKVKRTPRSVRRSLRRLERKGKIREHAMGWMVPHDKAFLYDKTLPSPWRR